MLSFCSHSLDLYSQVKQTFCTYCCSHVRNVLLAVCNLIGEIEKTFIIIKKDSHVTGEKNNILLNNSRLGTHQTVLTTVDWYPSHCPNNSRMGTHHTVLTTVEWVTADCFNSFSDWPIMNFDSKLTNSYNRILVFLNVQNWRIGFYDHGGISFFFNCLSSILILKYFKSY